jgi:amidophosphoribosyltransferase
MGLVADVFPAIRVGQIEGTHGHWTCALRHGGASSLFNAQPIVVMTARGPLAIGHNGNLTNAVSLRKKLESEGSIFQTSSDTEVVLHLIAKSPARDLVNAMKEAFNQVTGAYSIVLQTPKMIFAVRDPWGVRPSAHRPFEQVPYGGFGDLRL